MPIDVVEAQLAEQKADTEQKVQLVQTAAEKASEDAANALATAREEIGSAKAEAIAAAEEKDVGVMATAKSSMDAGDASVKLAAEEAAAGALADAKVAMDEADEKVKQAAKAGAEEALGAAAEADKKAASAAREAEVAKTLPEPKEPIVYSVYFNLGQASLSKATLAELEKAAAAIKSMPGATVKVEGHTDNIPVVHSSQHKNNWGLSQARAKAVTKHLVDKLAVSADAITNHRCCFLQTSRT